MTKKDYIKIAEILKRKTKFYESVEDYADQIIADFIKVLSEDNPRFDSKRFIDYINKEDKTKFCGNCSEEVEPDKMNNCPICQVYLD